MKFLSITLIQCLIIVLLISVRSMASDTDPIIFIYDASGSMWGKMEDRTKVEIARDVLSSSVMALKESQPIGLVAYGHRKEGDCKDVEILVDMENTDKGIVTAAIRQIKPLGKTPLAFSASEVISGLKESEKRATIILITDGIESCDGNICKVIREAKMSGIDFKLHIVGFGLKNEDTEQLRCAAKEGDGKYYDALDSEGLSDVIMDATSYTVDVAAGNYTLYASKNDLPIDALIKVYEKGEDTEISSVRTYSDTVAVYLKEGNYDLTVTPLGNSDVNPLQISIEQQIGEDVLHTTISFDAGLLKVMASNNGEGHDALINIKDQEGKYVARGRTYGREDEYDINPGVYDVEMKLLNVKGEGIQHVFEDVQILAAEESKVNHDFKTGTLKIGASSQSGLVDAVIEITNAPDGKRVDYGRTYTSPGGNPGDYILMAPATYKISAKGLGDHKGKSNSTTIELKAGEEVEHIFKF